MRFPADALFCRQGPQFTPSLSYHNVQDNDIHTMPQTNTRDLVRKAAESLTAQGLKVSVRRVREAIGKGSATTIAEELRDWRNQDLAPRSQARDSTWPEVPHSLVQEAEAMYFRVLGIVWARFSGERADQALLAVRKDADMLAVMAQLNNVTSFGTAASRELLLALEDRAKAEANLRERDVALAELQQRLEQLTAELANRTKELVDLKLSSAQQQTRAYERAEGLSKHLLRMTEEQRSQIAAPLVALKERYESLSTRESVMTQQLYAIRNENSQLKERLLGFEPK